MGIRHCFPLRKSPSTPWSLVVTRERSGRRSSSMHTVYKQGPKTLHDMLLCAVVMAQLQAPAEVTVFTTGGQEALPTARLKAMDYAGHTMSFKMGRIVYLCRPGTAEETAAWVRKATEAPKAKKKHKTQEYKGCACVKMLAACCNMQLSATRLKLLVSRSPREVKTPLRGYSVRRRARPLRRRTMAHPGQVEVQMKERQAAEDAPTGEPKVQLTTTANRE